MVKTFEFFLETKGFCDIKDITQDVEYHLRESGLKEGMCLVFIPGATAAVTTTEFEPGNIKDYQEFIEKIIPRNSPYHHNNTWHDGNGFSHLRASLQKPSICIPFKDGKLIRGTWQNIVVIDFDNRSRTRKVVIQFIGE